MLESMVQAVALEKLRITILPDGRMTRDDAAKYLGLKSKTLAAWHLQKRGPVSSSSEDAATIFGPSWIGSSLKARRLAREMMKDQDGGGAALNDKAADDPRGLPPPMAFTVREFCRVYGVGKTFAHNLISRGTLKKRYAGKRLLFTAASAASWFDSLPDQPPNAFTVDELIAWIEDKLREQGIEKVVPDDKMLETAYRRAAEAKYFRGHSKPILEDAAAVAIPPDLGKKVSDKFGSGPELPWDRAVWDVVQEGGE